MSLYEIELELMAKKISQDMQKYGVDNVTSYESEKSYEDLAQELEDVQGQEVVPLEQVLRELRSPN